MYSKEMGQSQDVQQEVQPDVQRQVELARQLFLKEGNFILSVVRYVSSNSEYVEDLFHEMFLFFAAKPIPRDVTNIRGYLYKVVSDKVKDWQRAHSRYQTKIRNYYEIKSKQLSITQPVKEEEWKNIQNIFGLIEKHLSKAEVKAITLRYKNQYAIEEIAKEMNIKTRTVSRYISIGLSKIRTLLNIEEKEDHEKKK